MGLLHGGGMDIEPTLAVFVEDGDPHVVTLVGDFDLGGASAVRTRLSQLDGDVDVDCSGLEFIDSSGLQVLVEANTACAARDATLVLVDPSKCVQRLLAMTGLHTLFRVRSARLSS
jgi:anti-anti-sigma factor